jgi:alkanesulfonate monooxygenase SsuD/methylene tetrahydromethanopterin reductase-like flavin-dependent oxidoreductase (luciferase family)
LADVGDYAPLDSSNAKFFFNFGDHGGRLYFGLQALAVAMVVLAAIAELTGRIRLCSSALALSLDDPVHVSRLFDR